MCLPMSGLGLAGKAVDRKPLSLLSPALALAGVGKKKDKSKPAAAADGVTVSPGVVGPPPGSGAFGYGG